MRQRRTKLSIYRRSLQGTAFCLLFLLAVCFLPAKAAQTRATSPYAIIDQVNLLRASYGLAPYTVDSGLMSAAQAHSNYQASIKTATHTRANGSSPWEMGYEENIATGMIGFLTPENAVFSIWQDAIHLKPMVGYASGSIGAGVANDGVDEYYTIDVRPPGGLPSGDSAADPNAPPTELPSPIPLVPLVTSTSHPDGSLVHLVGYGQTMWSIAEAYHISMDQIRAWNNIKVDSSDIYAGQLLLVWPLTLVTISPTPTATATVPTSTPTHAADTPTPKPSATITPTASPSPTKVSVLQAAGEDFPLWGAGLVVLGIVLGVWLAVKVARKNP
ncbi:MAG: LysM peptidoglycan-binding domain-containing protein [Chloroflexi bacterium]|nr:LysM peptidoglycan-binding domain-containing protein [Chloroflexota bacterium]